MDYFKGIIKCKICKKRIGKESNFNRKNNNSTIEYICSRKKNYNDCNSQTIKEKMLYEVIEKHCQIYNKAYSPEKTKLFILRIEVDSDGIKIFWRDGLVSRISESEIIF